MGSHRKPTGDINSASMSDIAFLLLIFFLVTTIFALEEGIPMVLPPKTPPKKMDRNRVLTVQAHASGELTIDNKQVTLTAVGAIVKERLVSNPKLVVVIESHPDSEYGLMIDLLDELRLVDARRISLRPMPVRNQR